MKMILKYVLLFMLSGLTVLVGNAQQKDTIIIQRDNIGDMNAPFVKAGEIPGALLLPGTNISLAIGGFVKATAIYDTHYTVKNEIILPGMFSEAQMGEGQTYIGARSSRLFFRGVSTVKQMRIDGYFEMDYRGASGFTLRHAYLQLQNQKGSKFLMGQYWSLAMDLLTIPEGLVEPTISGGPFARHGQMRYSGKLSKALTLSVSLEEPSTSDFTGVNVTPVNKAPDGIATLAIDPSPALHFSLMGLYRPVVLSLNPGESKEYESGFLTGASVVLRPNDKTKFTLNGMYGQGASSYIMGADAIAGYYINGVLEKQKQSGGFTAFRHVWNEKFRSNVAFGKFFGSELESMPDPNIKSSTFVFINTFYHVNKYVNIGVEWIFTSKEFHGADRLKNNRIQFGIQVF